MLGFVKIYPIIFFNTIRIFWLNILSEPRYSNFDVISELLRFIREKAEVQKQEIFMITRGIFYKLRFLSLRYRADFSQLH